MKLGKLDFLQIGHTIQMSGSIYSSADKTFLCFFPEDDKSLPLEVLDMSVEEWKAFLRQTDLLEAEVLAKASDGTLAKAVLRKSQRHIDQAVSWRVWKRDLYSCRYCGKDDVPLTVDHLICWEDCGPSIESNLLSSDRKCNKIRGSIPYAEWLQHPYYKGASRNLRPEVQAANEALVSTLDSIPRVVHVKSR